MCVCERERERERDKERERERERENHQQTRLSGQTYVRSAFPTNSRKFVFL